MKKKKNPIKKLSLATETVQGLGDGSSPATQCSYLFGSCLATETCDNCPPRV